MSFRLIDSGWDKELDNAAQADHSSVRIICPFIKLRAVERVLKYGKPATLQVITRFDLGGFYEGVSDISAFRKLLDYGAQIRGIHNLHSKLYLFGTSQAIVTSANLTDAALLRNHEFGFVADDVNVIQRCRQYFDRLWNQAGQNLSESRLDDWESKVTNNLILGTRPLPISGLGDEGVDVGLQAEPVALPTLVSEANQAFVKFFGISSKRAKSLTSVSKAIAETGCDRVCRYPENKRPQSVEDGALMFMGWLVEDPDDVRIFGRAIGMSYEPGRDDATAVEIASDPTKAKWPHYIRVHHGEFINGNLSSGVSMNQLMDILKSDAFLSTQRNAANGYGNTDPRKAYMQQASVRLTQQAVAWLNARLEDAFAKHGKITPSMLDQSSSP